MKDTDRYFICLVFHAEAIFDLWEIAELECLLFVFLIQIFISHRCISKLDQVLM